MADRLSGMPVGPEFFLGGRIPWQMVEDLLAVADIPEERIDAIAAELEKQDGFLTPARLGQLLGDMPGEERWVVAAAAAVENIRPERIDATLLALRRWRSAPGNAERFPEQALQALEKKLPRLIRAYPSLTRYRKALRLRSVTGNKIESIELVCDARPVFNEGRTVVEGFIPLTTLKIAYQGQDENEYVLEAHLTGTMLDDLIKEAEKARRKLSVLDADIQARVPNGLVSFTD
jgi:hypothetical protein